MFPSQKAQRLQRILNPSVISFKSVQATFTTEAIVLSQEPDLEKTHRLHLLTPEMGVCMAHWRRSNSRKTALPAIYSHIHVTGKSADAGGHLIFVNDTLALGQWNLIARHYNSFECAGAWARFMIQNRQWISEPKILWKVTLKALEAWNQKTLAEAVLLKAFYVFCKHEGIGIQEEWAERLSENHQSLLNMIICTRSSELELTVESVQTLQKDLYLWLRNNSEFNL
jgi:hypothetical protein